MKLQKYLICIAALFFCLCLAGAGLAESIISGHYSSKTPTRLILEINIGSPAPENLIVIQHVPPGTAVANASPALKKYNKKRGEIRWLLRNVQAGTHRLQLTLQAPVNPDMVHAEIRCKNPASRQMITTTVR